MGSSSCKCKGTCGSNKDHKDHKCCGKHDNGNTVIQNREKVEPPQTIFSFRGGSTDGIVAALKEDLAETARRESNTSTQGSSPDTLMIKPINFGIPYTGNKVTALSPVTSTEVADFHSKRLLFTVIGPRVYAETEPSGLSHIEWVKTLDLSEAIIPFNGLDAEKDYHYIIDNFIRGYYYNNTIVLYKGMHFSADSSVVDTVRFCLRLIAAVLKLKDDTLVGMGCIVEPGTVFEIEHLVGTVAEIKELDDFSKWYKLVR